MQNREAIKSAIERNVRAVSARPSVGQGTAVTKVSWRHGLTCDAEDGPWKFTVGMTDKEIERLERELEIERGTGSR